MTNALVYKVVQQTQLIYEVRPKVNIDKEIVKFIKAQIE
jgi:ATP-dependent DNA helicase RecQ